MCVAKGSSVNVACLQSQSCILLLCPKSQCKATLLRRYWLYSSSQSLLPSNMQKSSWDPGNMEVRSSGAASVCAHKCDFSGLTSLTLSPSPNLSISLALFLRPAQDFSSACFSERTAFVVFFFLLYYLLLLCCRPQPRTYIFYTLSDSTFHKSSFHQESHFLNSPTNLSRLTVPLWVLQFKGRWNLLLCSPPNAKFT